MKDQRFVDDLNLEELERVLLIKRREARLARLRRMDRSDQVVGRDPLDPPPPSPELPPIPTGHRQFQGIGASASYQAMEVEEARRPFFSVTPRLIDWLSAPLRVNWRFVFNSIFLLIEITAVVALVGIIVTTWQGREQIDEAVEVLFVAPTPTPTKLPLVNAVVLPGGHTPPDARGFSQPEPIPRHLEPLAQRITPQPVPTRGPDHATRVVIPAIGVDHPVVPGDDWEALKRGIGHTLWSANPGEAGNCVLSAFNDVYGEIFRRLPDMALDDEILVYTSTRVYRYVVKATRVVEPTQVEVMDPTDHPTLTLVSAYPYLVDNKRIVVIAELTVPE